jgi:taurine--2-oxoglutarate transaminase
MDVRAISAKHTYGTWRRQKGFNPLHVVSAEGCFFTDSSGKKYLDFSSQLMCSNLGHGNRAVIDAIKQQAEELAFIAPGYTTTARAELAQELLTVMPKGITKFFFGTSGTDANEAAFKIARMVTGKHKIISRYSSYHGSTAGSVSNTGDFRRWIVDGEATVPGTQFGPDCNCYRCPLKKNYPDCGIACADYIEYMIERDGNIAAVLVEPIVGTNGVLVPPPEYLPRLREITKKHGVLLIADEVMTGWGRAGDWFAVEHDNVVPDILTTAKGVTSAYVPLGVTATTAEVAAFFEENFFAHGHTYESHPLMLKPATAAIREYKRLNLIERSRTMGEILGGKLKALAAKHPSVGDVRGRGLFWGLEIVRDRATKTPFNTQREKIDGKPLVIDQITAKTMSLGVTVQGWISHLVIAPPLIISEAEIDQGVAAIDEALAIADAALS